MNKLDEIIIRKATIEDLPEINEIYNYYVNEYCVTADTIPVSMEERKRWFLSHDENKYPIFISEYHGDITGWISLSPHRPGRFALRYTAEVSYYLHHNYLKKGIGSLLLDYVINNCAIYEIKNVYALLLDVNMASIKLLKKFGFEKWGHLPCVADFEGKEVGQYIYGRRIYTKPSNVLIK